MKRILALAWTLAILAAIFGAAAWAETMEETPVEAQATAVETLEYGSKGDAVKRLQQRLKELGYYKGKVSGNFLEGTQYGLKRFQHDYGLEETGALDAQTDAWLALAEYRTLSDGCTGEDVQRLQERLIALDYLNAKATGKYLSMTTAAVKAFQERNALAVTGEADADTQKALFNDMALGANDTAATEPIDPAQPTPMPAGDINDVVMVEDGVDMDDPTPRPTKTYKKKLQRASKGEDVKALQNRLTELGYYTGPISGNYQNKTIAAVKAFQTNNGFKASGVTDEQTWNAVFNELDPVDADSTPRPTPDPTPIPYAITVDVKNQAVIVYGRDDNGEYTQVVKEMVCSTGMKSTPSDVGTWVLTGRRARWAYFSLYGSHAQYWTRINSNIAFHSVIYRTVDTMNLSVKSYNMLGSRASHGCIRLLVSDSKWIYDNCGEGTVVTITEDLPANEELRHILKPPALNKANMLPYTTPEPTAKPAYSATGTPPQPFRRLKRGSEGEDVYWLQRKLQDLGFYQGTATGEFLQATERALKKYQKANGIYADGVADDEVLELIYADVLPTATPEAMETPAPDAQP